MEKMTTPYESTLQVLEIKKSIGDNDLELNNLEDQNRDNKALAILIGIAGLIVTIGMSAWVIGANKVMQVAFLNNLIGISLIITGIGATVTTIITSLKENIKIVAKKSDIEINNEELQKEMDNILEYLKEMKMEDEPKNEDRHKGHS